MYELRGLQVGQRGVHSMDPYISQNMGLGKTKQFLGVAIEGSGKLEAEWKDYKIITYPICQGILL